jgi:hypothetical protein
MDSNSATKRSIQTSLDGRIPASLQAIFLASNQGATLQKPPPTQVGSMEFVRDILIQRKIRAKSGSIPTSGAKNSTFRVSKKSVNTKVTLYKSVGSEGIALSKLSAVQVSVGIRDGVLIHLCAN